MNPAASPRHPWKALAVVLLMFAVVHGARAHVFSHDPDFSHVHIVHSASFDHDCPDVDVDIDDGPDDDPVFDVFDDAGSDSRISAIDDAAIADPSDR